MTRDELLKAIEKNTVPGLLLFEGDEENLKHEALDLLRRSVLPDGMEELNETVLTAPDADSVMAAAETLPFLAERRLVIIRDQDGFTGKKEPEEKLIRYLSTPASSCILIFYCEGKPDKRRKLYSTIKTNGSIVTFVQLKGAALSSWIIEQFSHYGKKCSVQNADYLAFTCGSDTELLTGEISKLSSLSSDRDEILADDINALATRSTECTVFQLADAVTSGQNSRALQLMQDLLHAGEEPLAILGMLTRNFRILRSLMIMKAEKKDNGYISSRLGLNPYSLEQYKHQLSLISGRQIKSAVESCMATDFGIKSGRINMEGSIEALILKLLDLMHRRDN